MDNTINNYDYLGGWIMNSPHTWDKLANYGVEKEKDEIEKSITGKDNTYVIVRLDRDTDWISEYYSDKRNTIVSINSADTIADKFNVFKVTLN